MRGYLEVITLGIADNHDSGAALVVDGQLVAAINQERIDRIKGSSAFPWGAIDSVLSEAGVSARDVDHIVVGTAFTLRCAEATASKASKCKVKRTIFIGPSRLHDLPKSTSKSWASMRLNTAFASGYSIEN